MNNTTKRSIHTSLTALLLCFVMLVGTTFAWFTDTATSEGNVIQSGNLKIDLLLLDKETGVFNSIKENSAPIYSDDILWEPGYTDVKILKVSNEGTLNLKWVAKFVSDKELSPLAEVIDVYVNPSIGDNPTYPTDRQLDANWQHVGTLDQFIGTISETTYGFLGAGKSANLGIALKMQETADNNYQDKTLGEFTIKVLATQATGESDSFDDQYDAGAEWPNTGLNESASADIDASNLILGALTTAVNIDNGNVSATIPEDVKVAEGATSFDLTVKSADADGNISFGEGGSATGFDVHIAGVAADNTQPMTVNLGAVLPTGLGETELKLYHTENGVPELMTRVGSTSEFTIHNQYTYNAETGEVSIYVASFSVFTAVKTTDVDLWDGSSAKGFASGSGTKDSPYLINTAEQFAYFRDQVDGGNTFKDQYVKLGIDINLNNISFNPIGYNYVHKGGQAFMGTFDGGKHTIYNLNQNGWDLEAKYPGEDYTTSTAGGGLFASIKDATIKNLAVSDANIVMECIDMGIVVGYAQGSCTFDNIVVTSSKIANYQRYTGGVVGEVSGDPADSSVVGKHTFTNITVDSSVVVGSLWGDFDNACGGVIGGKWGNATVYMENVTVAARIDAFSDVTAAYQWYAYRRCGMLIGHTEQNSPKKATNAAADFLTCKNVNVYYGDWVNYTYYQFTNQTDEGGNKLWYSNYPWVRAEAGENNGAFSNVRYGNPVVNGIKIDTKELAEEYMTCTEPVTITFNQLYGGGQGVYGTASHTANGSTVYVHKISDIATTTIKFQNNGEWSDVKIEYLFAHGNDTWSTLVEGLDATSVSDNGTYDVYTFNVPAIAHSIKITGTGKSTAEFKLADVKSNEIYALNIAGTELVETRKVTFTPDTTWKSDKARFALYAFDADNHNTWYNLKAEGSSYVCYLPVDYTGANICRMAPNTQNDWANEWNQTPNITLSGVNDYTHQTKIYLSLGNNTNWTIDNARFAAYFFNNSTGKNTWVSMTYNKDLGVYECAIPSGDWPNVIFCRMNPSASANNWNNKWNQTGDLTHKFGEEKYTIPNNNWDGHNDGNNRNNWAYFSNGTWYKHS